MTGQSRRLAVSAPRMNESARYTGFHHLGGASEVAPDKAMRHAQGRCIIAMRWWSVKRFFQFGGFGLRFFKGITALLCVVTLMVRAVIFWSWTVCAFKSASIGFPARFVPSCNSEHLVILHLQWIVLMVVTLGAAEVSRREPAGCGNTVSRVDPELFRSPSVLICVLR